MPFETLTLRFGGTFETPDDRYGALWQPSPGVEVAAALPFYLGLTLDAGLAFSIHGAEAETLPDFLAMHGYGGLGPTFRLPAGMRLRTGVHAGILSMDFFEDESVTAAVRRESELAAGFYAEGVVPLTGRLGIVVGVRWTHVYTSTTIDLVRAQAGLAWTFDTPRWLREALR
ncbi:MAG: hypothetical protein AAGG50_07855 [Bacteroidota bacterium]